MAIQENCLGQSQCNHIFDENNIKYMNVVQTGEKISTKEYVLSSGEKNRSKTLVTKNGGNAECTCIGNGYGFAFFHFNNFKWKVPFKDLFH